MYFAAKTTHPTAKVSEGTNGNMPVRNTMVQLLALYADPESHKAQRHRQTDRRTDDMTIPIADHSLLCSTKLSSSMIGQNGEVFFSETQCR